MLRPRCPRAGSAGRACSSHLPLLASVPWPSAARARPRQVAIPEPGLQCKHPCVRRRREPDVVVVGGGAQRGDVDCGGVGFRAHEPSARRRLPWPRTPSPTSDRPLTAARRRSRVARKRGIRWPLARLLFRGRSGGPPIRQLLQQSSGRKHTIQLPAPSLENLYRMLSFTPNSPSD